MKPNVFYTSLDIRSNQPVDKRMYIDDLTIPNLTDLFGADGKYGIANAILFNRTTKKYHYFTGASVPSPDILDPANWAEQTFSSEGKFIEWANDTSYVLGSTVYDPNTSLNHKFYICKVANSTIGDAPYLTSDEWFEVSAGSGAKQTTTLELDLASVVPFSIDVNYNSINLPDLPAVNVFGLYDISQWDLIEPEVQVFPGTPKVTIIFNGDLQNSGLVSGQDNIKVVIQ